MIFFQRDVFLPFQLFLLFDLLIWCWTTIFLNSSGGQKILLAIRLKYGEEIGDKAMCVLQDGNLIPCWDSVWHSSITDLELRWVQKTAVSSVWEQENEVYLDVPAETTVEHSETEPTHGALHYMKYWYLYRESQIHLVKEKMLSRAPKLPWLNGC